jgi:hypothetical protein
MSKVDYIKARFRGREIIFRLDPRLAPLFEAHMSAFHRFQRFGAGVWEANDIRVVLSFAHPQSIIGVCPEVDDAIARHVTAYYLRLAILVLEAYLFGIDEEKAIFDEDTV